MKRKGAKGLGGGWEKRRGMKMIQFMCNKRGSKRMRRAEAVREDCHCGRRRERSRESYLALQPNDPS
jgi:hypothetical protein